MKRDLYTADGERFREKVFIGPTSEIRYGSYLRGATTEREREKETGAGGQRKRKIRLTELSFDRSMIDVLSLLHSRN